MSFQNLQTNEVYRLNEDEPVILGRGRYGLEDPYTSRQHVKITLLSNGKCFVEKVNERNGLSRNMAKLNSTHLPDNKEIEAYDHDVLEIPVNNLFRLMLPKSSKGVYRPKTIIIKKDSEEDDTDNEFEPLSLVEQTDNHDIASTLGQKEEVVLVEEEEERVDRGGYEITSERFSHGSSSSSSSNDGSSDEDGSRLIPSDESISSESDLLGDY